MTDFIPFGISDFSAYLNGIKSIFKQFISLWTVSSFTYSKILNEKTFMKLTHIQNLPLVLDLSIQNGFVISL